MQVGFQTNPERNAHHMTSTTVIKRKTFAIGWDAPGLALGLHGVSTNEDFTGLSNQLLRRLLLELADL